MRLRFFPALALCLIGCSGAAQSFGPLPPGGHRVLFIGNSLTYVNDLPRTLSDLAALSSDTIKTLMVAKPNFSLGDHLDDGDAAKAIKAGGWEYVVMQQGPSSLETSRTDLIASSQRFKNLAAGVGARLALYSVWPALENFSSFARVGGSYYYAAQAVDGKFFPCGVAWQLAWETNASLPLYGGDNFHPSPLGTYLAALVMYEQITGKDARNLPTTVVVGGQSISVDAAVVRVLQEAAHKANTDYGTVKPGPL